MRLFPRAPGVVASRLAAGAAAVAAVALALQLGFESPPLPEGVTRFLQVGSVVLHAWWRLTQWGDRARRQALWLTQGPEWVLFAVAAVMWWPGGAPGGTIVAVLYVVAFHGARRIAAAFGYDRSVPGSVRHPGRVVVLTFTGLIAIGTVLLCLPRAVAPEARQGPWPERVVNALFTATSAACVTGLVVYDTATDYTRFGHVVILLLIQLGGLGIMIYGSIFAVLFRRQLTLRESLVLQDIYQHDTLGHIARTTWFVCAATLGIEAVAAIGLYGMWPESLGSSGTRWFYSIFHAVSAFCNAGFALDGDSLIAYRDTWQVYGCILPAIVLGGLGFPVIANLLAVGHGRWLRRQPRPRLTLHTRLVVVATALLIVVPAAVIFLFEQPDSAGPGTALRDLPIAQRVLGALFQSVTCRTAGFNTISLAESDVAPGTLFLMCILMFVGGSPASTAGGVKTIAVSVMLLGVWSTLRRREHVDVGGREIPAQTVRQAGVVLIVMFALVSGVVLLLCFTEDAGLPAILFETVSACSTVGLTTGLTTQLTFAGKLVIMLAMFAGRLGPLTLLVALAGRQRTPSYNYPVEQICIG